MKKILFALAFVSTFAFAEASFDQIEQLIGQQQYAAAEQGLEGIIKNHPNSAKAYYAMAQAQAGLGNQQKAQYALDKARGLDPDLKFASSSSVEKLQEAIRPQVKKIEVVEESHTVRNTLLLIFVIALGYVAYSVYRRNKDADDKYETSGGSGPKNPGPDDDYHKASPSDQAYMREHNMGPKTTYAAKSDERKMEMPSARVTAPAPAPVYSAPITQPAPTVVNNHYGSNNDGLLTGVILGNMMSNHHDHTVVVEKEIYREVPSKSYSSSSDSSWDSSDSKSSSWDSSSSRSSSWDSDSDSSSSSSWSSSSDSSSSWDSGSSSSDSSW